MMGAPCESVPTKWAVPIASVELNHSVICPVAMSNREIVVLPLAAKAIYQMALLVRLYPASELPRGRARTVQGTGRNSPVAGPRNLRVQHCAGPGVWPDARQLSLARRP